MSSWLDGFFDPTITATTLATPAKIPLRDANGNAQFGALGMSATGPSVPTGKTLLQTQGVSAGQEISFKFQPFTAARAWAGLVFQGATFNSTVDNTLNLGWNPKAIDATNAALYLTFEDDYEQPALTHYAEFYIEGQGVSGANIWRPFFINYGKAAGDAAVILNSHNQPVTAQENNTTIMSLTTSAATFTSPLTLTSRFLQVAQVNAPSGTQHGRLWDYVDYATTTNAVTVAQQIGPSASYFADEVVDIIVDVSVSDVANAREYSFTIRTALTNFASVTAVRGSSVTTGGGGTAALNTCTIAFAIASGQMQFTYTPPAAYAGTLRWTAKIRANGS